MNISTLRYLCCYSTVLDHSNHSKNQKRHTYQTCCFLLGMYTGLHWPQETRSMKRTSLEWRSVQDIKIRRHIIHLITRWPVNTMMKCVQCTSGIKNGKLMHTKKKNVDKVLHRHTQPQTYCTYNDTYTQTYTHYKIWNSMQFRIEPWIMEHTVPPCYIVHRLFLTSLTKHTL